MRPCWLVALRALDAEAASVLVVVLRTQAAMRPCSLVALRALDAEAASVLAGRPSDYVAAGAAVHGIRVCDAAAATLCDEVKVVGSEERMEAARRAPYAITRPRLPVPSSELSSQVPPILLTHRSPAAMVFATICVLSGRGLHRGECSRADGPLPTPSEEMRGCARGRRSAFEVSPAAREICSGGA